MDHEAHSCNKFVNMKSQRVKVEGSFAPALEDETETIAHLLAEPKSEYVTVDGVLCCGKENAGKGVDIEDFSCAYDFGLNTYSGGLHSAHPRGRYDELEFGVLDGLLDEVDEVEDIHAINGLASPCDDYLLDIGFTGKASELGFGPCEKSHLGNSSSESQSPRLSGSSNGAVGISESSTVTIQEFECKNNSIDKAVTHEFHGGFRRKKRRRTPVEDNVYPASINLQNLELDNDEKSLSKKSKESNERENCSAVTATQDHSKVRCQNEHHHVSPGILSSVPEEDSISENQTLAEFRTQRKLAKKHASILALESDEQPITSESEDDHVPKKRSRKHDRRKHQRMWTLSEVTTLVDGISEYGVGRWTDIKRVLFSTSAYRTPIDLRDKWRNLLRASCGKKMKKEVEQKEMRALPKSLVRRVRELATVHPYPRQRGKKFAPPILPTPSKSASCDLIRKYVRRKNRS
ncbi:uncharacterized protein Pyn_21030 [Prunus yedoensis var. nudiflora]|uniref:Uncharacterized protein n=1 Tax=Prunus yedoensis var. nudiflora TaxID=2094558 RepID=A0A314ZP83_PRUYE|nr:uncharacterized protein Pyn_21030 [Prunus yedoensis var. nudiflora]